MIPLYPCHIYHTDRWCSLAGGDLYRAADVRIQILHVVQSQQLHYLVSGIYLLELLDMQGKANVLMTLLPTLAVM